MRLVSAAPGATLPLELELHYQCVYDGYNHFAEAPPRASKLVKRGKASATAHGGKKARGATKEASADSEDADVEKILAKLPSQHPLVMMVRMTEQLGKAARQARAKHERSGSRGRDLKKGVAAEDEEEQDEEAEADEEEEDEEDSGSDQDTFMTSGALVVPKSSVYFTNRLPFNAADADNERTQKHTSQPSFDYLVFGDGACCNSSSTRTSKRKHKNSHPPLQLFLPLLSVWRFVFPKALGRVAIRE